MWFSIIKNKLLIKPKTQLRVQDNKAVEDDEPCKKRLKEYIDFFQKQKKNYEIMKDPEVNNVIEEYKLKPLKKEADYTDLYHHFYSDSPNSYIKRIMLENNDFILSNLIIHYHTDFRPDLWEDLPERVACEVLDMVDSQTESEVYTKVGSYEIGVYYNSSPKRIQFDIEVFGDEGYVFDIQLYTSVRVTKFEKIYNDKRKTNLKASLLFIRKMKDIFNKKADPKNWR
tara:strand:- start:1561 stop:2241 length:681 start_codon:yes stop_codon:yes gene_type:complete